MIKLPDTAEAFYKLIPTDIGQNIQFRIELHKMLAVDSKAQQVFLAMCREYLPIVFSTSFWTLNPQKKPGERNQPFILRPAQIPAVETLNWCIDNRQDAGLNKSRKQGASEICCKLFAAKALLENNSHFIIGSRKKELVDNYGDPYTLFAKVDNVFDCLPSWWLTLCGYDPKNNRKDMVLTIPATNSSFSGETTNENFGAGSRGTAILLDEIGRVDLGVAESIEGSVHDVADCVIYSSTHWLGLNHTFNKVLKKSTTKVINLFWYNNPEENYGMYTTSEPGKFEFVDKEYYEGKDYKVLTDITQLDPDSNEIQIIADGLKGIPSPYRSPWFDFQQFKRRGNKRDFICNVCGQPIGSADSPFDHEILQRIKKDTVRIPDYEGELYFKYDQEGKVDEDSIYFNEELGFGRLKWWGRLHFGRPDQHHNYIIGIDPSYGLGSANSAACIYDVNSHEQVGSWVDANTKPEDMADIIVALAYWVGGVDYPFLIWESNAGCGQTFGKRIIFNGYYNVYTQRREDSKTRKKVKKWGWASNEKAKEALLGDLGVALSGGLTEDNTYMHIVIREDELVDELFDYVFKEKGSGIVASSRADLGTGALERHGDRAIAAGLCVLGTKEQQEGLVENIRTPAYGSFKYYMDREEERKLKEKRELRRYLF